jgi:Ca2+-binding RTX toxin-like protein
VDGSSGVGGNFRLFGGGAADTLIGGGGNDLIYGDGGADILRGNAGADLFRYDETDESQGGAGNFDVIEGFVHGIDKIDLSRIDANELVDGNQAFTFIDDNIFSGTGSPSAASAGQLRAFNISGNIWQVEADTDGDGNADMVIHVDMTGPDPLNGNDFIL